MDRLDSLEKLACLAVRFRMLNETQAKQLLTDHPEADASGQHMVDSCLLSDTQLRFLISARDMKQIRCRDIKFGSVAVDMGFVSEQQVDDVLQRQKQIFIKEKKKRLIGDLMVEEQTITEEQRQDIIAGQKQLQKEQREMEAKQQGIEFLTSGDGLEWLIDKKARKATLRIPLEQPGENLLEHFHQGLEEHNITFGVVSDEVITAWFDEEGRSETLVIAQCKEPVPGHDGVVVYHFDTDPLKAGSIKDGDVIDYKDRGEIPQVEAGTVLAELSNSDPGVAGTNIHGEEIEPKIKKGQKLLFGKGASLDSDGKKVVAEVTGRPSLIMNGRICVYPEYKIDGNVGLETGHVDFDGEILVSGTVEADFKVTGGTLHANVVEAAEVDIKGDVIVRGGIIGAKIKAGGNLVAAYIRDSVIEAGGSVMVKKEISGSDVKCSGGVFSASCVILDSNISAAKGILAKNIGSEVSAPSTLSIGSDALIELQITRKQEEIADIENRQKELSKSIEDNKTESQNIDMEIAETAQIQDRSQVELRELDEKIEQFKQQGDQQQVEELEAEIPEIEARAKKAEENVSELFNRQDSLHEANTKAEQEIEELEVSLLNCRQDLEVLESKQEEEQSDVSVKVSDTIYPMTTIATAHSTVKTKQDMKAVEIKERSRKTASGDTQWKIVTEAYK